MSRSLGFAAYRVLSRRQPNQTTNPFPPRPSGEVLWAHATTEQRYAALCDIGLRLRILRPELHLVITCDQAQLDDTLPPMEGCDQIVLFESDHPEMAKQFLDHWHPDLCLWAGGHFMPNLITLASDTGIPMILLDLGEADLPPRRYNWLPDLTRPSLECFDMILVNNEATAQIIRRAGISNRNIRITARLSIGATPPLCSDEELDEMTRELAQRPVWLAAHLIDDEVDTVLEAHRLALKRLHRLLLVIVTDPAAETDGLKDKIGTMKLRSADWDTGDPIDDHVQVIFSRDTDNLGLWYRLAPLTFMANSLAPTSNGCSPLDAASLGSAILYGTNVKDHLETYSRLAAAGAARSVYDSDTLGSAVVQLAAPDQAAEMALAGWNVVTEGARMTDDLIDIIVDRLDNPEAPHAPT